MTDNLQQTDAPTVPAKKDKTSKPVPIGRFSLQEVDTALTALEKMVKTNSETVKAKLANNSAIPGDVLRELSRANAQKSRLVMRRLAILVDSGDSSAMELIDKLMKVKPPKPA